MYLMWQRLGGEPLTNANVVVSVILILLGSFPGVQNENGTSVQEKEIGSPGSLLCIHKGHPCLLPQMRVLMLVVHLELLENYLEGNSPL